MKNIFLFLLLVSLFIAAGCVNTVHPPAAPTGKGHLDLCSSDPSQVDYWQKTGDVLWSTPGGVALKDNTITFSFPACDNSSATIWDSTSIGNVTWIRITIHTMDGRAGDGWLPAGHLTRPTNETETEWSGNYSSVVGRWDQTERGNAAKIWFEFTPDGTYTYNYDMRGNKENIRDRGNWMYLGNGTYELISNTYSDHQHFSIVIDPVTKTFRFGMEYSSSSEIGTEKIFAKV